MYVYAAYRRARSRSHHSAKDTQPHTDTTIHTQPPADTDPGNANTGLLASLGRTLSRALGVPVLLPGVTAAGGEAEDAPLLAAHRGARAAATPPLPPHDAQHDISVRHGIAHARDTCHVAGTGQSTCDASKPRGSPLDGAPLQHTDGLSAGPGFRAGPGCCGHAETHIHQFAGHQSHTSSDTNLAIESRESTTASPHSTCTTAKPAVTDGTSAAQPSTGAAAAGTAGTAAATAPAASTPNERTVREPRLSVPATSIEDTSSVTQMVQHSVTRERGSVTNRPASVTKCKAHECDHMCEGEDELVDVNMVAAALISAPQLTRQAHTHTHTYIHTEPHAELAHSTMSAAHWRVHLKCSMILCVCVCLTQELDRS